MVLLFGSIYQHLTFLETATCLTCFFYFKNDAVQYRLTDTTAKCCRIKLNSS